MAEVGETLWVIDFSLLSYASSDGRGSEGEHKCSFVLVF